ncbi:Uma2 family endonuclease [Methylobacterium nodulans]|nr:Uma2 family endonuclease [Methylobacterium nodulans]
MIEAGVIAEGERIELLDGELVEMASKSYAHDLVKNRLNRRLTAVLPSSIYLATESTVQLDARTLLEPDFLLAFETAHRPSPEGFCVIPGPEILLVIEVAASSLAYDLGRKAHLYARYGVPEYWVIDAQERVARVHRRPSGDAGYGAVTDHPHSAVLTPQAAALAAVAIPLADLA